MDLKINFLRIHPSYIRMYEIMIELQKKYNNKFLFKNYKCELSESFYKVLDQLNEGNGGNYGNDCREVGREVVEEIEDVDEFTEEDIKKRLQELLPKSIYEAVETSVQKDDDPYLDLMSFHSGEYDIIEQLSESDEESEESVDEDAKTDVESLGSKTEVETAIEIDIEQEDFNDALSAVSDFSA